MISRSGLVRERHQVGGGAHQGRLTLDALQGFEQEQALFRVGPTLIEVRGGPHRPLDGEQLDTAWYVAGVMCTRADARQPPTAPEFDRVMHANVRGAMQAIPQVAPLVEAAGGRFGFVSSTMGRIGEVDASNAWLYRVSKAALNMAVASARHSYPRAVLAAFHPGWVQTDMGGAQAPVTIGDSVAGLRRALAALTLADSGAFVRYDGQRLASW